MMDKVKSVEVITHYNIDDEDCSNDYADIELLINGKKVASYGDFYHDKGKEKIEGFLDGIKYLTGFKGKIKYTDKADREY